jgi:hypothetical protein
MVLVLVLGCGLGWVAHRARVQREAVAAIERAGGKVFYDWQLKYSKMGDLMPDSTGQSRWPRWLVDRLGPDYFSTVKMVFLFGPADAVMPQVGRLDQLEELDFMPGRKDRTTLGPTDVGMVHLRDLTRLRHLKLGVNFAGGHIGSKITGAGLAAIAGCTRLWFLQLQGIPLADADLAALRGMTELRILDIDSPKVTAAGLAHLRGMNQLQHLNLSFTGVESLEPLRSLASLSHLQIVRSPIGDGGLAPASVPGFPELNSLNLSGTRVTDDGLKYLRDLPKLKGVMLAGTAVTDSGIAEFQKDRPNIRLSNVRPGPPAKKSAAPAGK